MHNRTLRRINDSFASYLPRFLIFGQTHSSRRQLRCGKPLYMNHWGWRQLAYIAIIFWMIRDVISYLDAAFLRVLHPQSEEQ
jgi:hypothetical protein